MGTLPFAEWLGLDILLLHLVGPSRIETGNDSQNLEAPLFTNLAVGSFLPRETIGSDVPMRRDP